jgi:hypothetical protein
MGRRDKSGTFGPIRGTRYPDLRYQRRVDHWRILDTQGRAGGPMFGIGPQYATEAELLADLDRMARVYGC